MGNIKICRTCNKSKPLKEFNKSSRAKDGIDNKCKECKHNSYLISRIETIKRVRDYYKENRNEILRKKSIYTRKTKEAKGLYDKNYRKKNKQSLVEKGKEYRTKNRYLISTRRRERYYSDITLTQEKTRAYARKYRNNISDGYVLANLRKNIDKTIKPKKELIILKRKQLQLKRLKKQILKS